jgi:hypothetical protein
MNKFSNYPVDAVITWVDGGDENHQKKILPFLSDKEIVGNKNFRTRFDQVEEIKHTVDSILKFAKFIRNIYIVTDNQIPKFLKNKDTLHKYNNVKIIDHSLIFEDQYSFLPVFNCRPIETRLYKVPNLSEHFIYFNDDMFLIKETKVEDFFVKGFPVLRGKWFKLNEDNLLKKIFSSKNKKTRAGHKIAQQKGAKIIGFKKYFKFHHTPYSLRKSTFENFFKLSPETETLNIKHRFRNYEQFTPQGLANHIEIKNKTCVLKSDYQMIYIQSYKKPLFWLKYKLITLSKKRDKLFLCTQSLDQCPPEKLKFIKNWLQNTYN